MAQQVKGWSKMDEEAARQGSSIKSANINRAMPNGKGKKVGKGQHR